MKKSQEVVVNARFLTKPVTGVQRFAIEISRRLRKYLPDVHFVSPSNIVLEEVARELDVEVFGLGKGHVWEQIDLPLYLKKRGEPILLNLESTAPIYYQNKITTLHDIAFIRYPETYSWYFRTYYRLLTPIMLRTSKKVITVSNFSKREIVSKYKLPEDKVVVVYNAVSEKFTPIKNRGFREHKYILAVSSINKRKNFSSLLRAFSRLSVKNIMLYVVGEEHRVFGEGGISPDLVNIPNVQFVGRVDDEKLIELYSNAVFFVFPSLYEGFGIPPLEAQACGCPVLVARASALPEIYKDSALYCDPWDVEDIANKMERLLSDSALREELINKGFENVKRFNWNKSAEKVAQIVQDIREND